MNKIKTPFYDIKTKEAYKKGDEYKGKRKDLDHLFYKEGEEEAEIAAKNKWNKLTDKEKKAEAKKLGQFGKAKHDPEKDKKAKK